MRAAATRVFLVSNPGNGYWPLLHALLRTLPGALVVGEAATGADALDRLAALTAPPDVLLVSALVEQTPALNTFHRTLVQGNPTATIAYFSPSYDPRVDALRWEMGVLSYLCWDELGDADLRARFPRLLSGAVHALLHGLPVQSPSVIRAGRASAIVTPPPRDREPALTRREQEVLALLLSGVSDKTIARQLGTALSTVQDHVANLHVKFATHSRVQLGVRAAAFARADPADTPRPDEMASSLPAWRDRYLAASEFARTSAPKMENAP